MNVNPSTSYERYHVQRQSLQACEWQWGSEGHVACSNRVDVGGMKSADMCHVLGEMPDFKYEKTEVENIFAVEDTDLFLYHNFTVS